MVNPIRSILMCRGLRDMFAALRFRTIRDQSGASILAAVLAILAFTLLTALLVSIISTSASVGLQEELGVKAFYIADGGLQYALKNGTAPCDFNVSTPVALGGGTFTVASECMDNSAGCTAPTTVTDNPLLAASTTINVTSTAGYNIPGTIKVQSEYVFCRAAAAAQLTGCDRGTNGTAAADHALGTEMTQCTVTSTGIYPAGLLFFGDLKRVVQANVGQ